MTAPSITFVVAAYNSQATVLRTLGSLSCASKPSAVEILVIDDGSTDDTARLVDGFASLHRNVRVLHQANRGLGAARNRGLDEARGTYVTFCDADDLFLPDNHLLLSDAMTHAGTDVAVGSGFCLIEHKTMAEFHDTPLVSLLHHLGDVPERQFLKFLLQPTACTKLFRRSYVHAAGLRFTEGKLFEDVAFTTGALMHSERVSFHELPLFLYDVRRNGSITSESSARRLEIFDNIAPLLSALDRLALAPIARLAMLASLMRTVLWCLDNTPAALVPRFQQQLLDLFLPRAAGLSDADAALLVEYSPDCWDRRAIATISSLAKAAARGERQALQPA